MMGKAQNKELAQKPQTVRIKLCGLSRLCDIEWVNELMPEYIGFVFARKSRRYVDPETAKALRSRLNPGIRAAGVFVNEDIGQVAKLLQEGIIDIAQLHGSEDEEYIRQLRTLTQAPVIKAFRIETREDVQRARESTADYVLLDSGSGGTGTTFDWSLAAGLDRPYFLAGGLDCSNIKPALTELVPFAVDVSSGIETDSKKDKAKMIEFVHAVRSVTGKEEKYD